MDLKFKKSNVYIYGKGIVKSDLIIENGIFTSFNGASQGRELDDRFIIIPGLIDEHIHGTDNVDTMDKDDSCIIDLAKNMLKDGVTAFCPTTMSMGVDDILFSLRNIKKAIDDKSLKATIVGAHLEGPFISKLFKGAQKEDNIITPTKPLLDRFLEASGNSIKIVTLAYEEVDSDIIKYLKELGITISNGHSNCSYSLLEKGVDEGVTCLTHTFNAMKALHHRDIGCVGMALMNNEVYCELIADTFHVSKDAIRLLGKSRNNKNIILISDSMEARHMEPGVYSLGGQEVIVDSCTARLSDNTLAGSILSLNKAVLNIKNILNISLQEAIDMATINAAKNLKIEDKKGSIELGKDADFVIVDKDMNIYETYVNGQLAFKR